MRTVIVRDAMRIPLGKQGENNAVLVVWPEIAGKYAKLYGNGRFELVVVQKGKAYPAVVSVTGADLVWDVHAADVATAEVGSLELIYYVGDTIAKSQTWETIVVASKSADGMTEPPKDPARAWFDAIKRQIGDLSKLTTKAKENLVAAINEAARTGSGGGGTVKMRVDGGYIQYSTDGVTWENLIAVADLEGKPGKDGAPGAPGAPGKDGEPGKDGHTPKIAATKTGKITSITADGVEIAQIEDGADAASDLSLGITGAAVGQIVKVKEVDASGKPTAWETAEQIGKVRLLTTVTTDANASEIEIQGLNITSLPVSIRIKNTGSACGTGLNIAINGVWSKAYVGTLSTTRTDRAEVRAWLLDNGTGGVIGKAIMGNSGTNNYNWPTMPSVINALALGNSYHDGETKYFSAGTIVEIWEGVYPNVS